VEAVRNFVVVGHGVDPEGDFTLNDLCGGAGRLDVLLRCVSTAFFLSHGIRKDVELFLVLGRGPKTVRFRAEEMRYVNPDERSTGALVRNALLKRLDGTGEKQSSPGIHVSRRSFEEVVSQLPSPIWLAEDGEPWDQVLPEVAKGPGGPRDLTFVLSDHHDFSKGEEAVLHKLQARRVSLGPASLHSNHCITLVHYLLDRERAPGP
jgi:tRNA (pseudouridine54-N1)-methyltransferase